MNPHAQKARHTVGQRIAKELADLQTLVIALDDRLSLLAAVTNTALEAVNERHAQFRTMPLWARLRWLVVGAR